MQSKILLYVIFPISFFSCQLLKQQKTYLKTNLDKAVEYSNNIKAAELNKHLSVLASDEFEGRETTTPGQKKAADYIKKHFINSNISPAIDSSYYQQFNVDVSNFLNVEFKTSNKEFKIIEEYYSFGNPINTTIKEVLIVDVGYGVANKERNDYNNIDVNNKIVAIKRGLPVGFNHSEKEGNWRRKLKEAKEQGALAVIFKEPNYKNTDTRIKQYLKNPVMKMHGNQRAKPHLPVFVMNQTIVDSLIINKIPSSFSTNVSALKTAENVLGFIPGKNDEIIVLSAHYDHIGYDNGEICNGADDDGSGTSALLEIAKTFQKAYDSGIKPQRGILFLSVSGEEKGLFGSQFYTDHPVFPLSKTTTNLNIDMVGRQDTVQENNNYIYLIGADRISNELHEISENINDQYINFKLDYTYNDKEDPNRFYERSDHYNFAKNNIPVIFYFGGLHEDYHKPTDDVEKIDFLKLEKVSRYVFLTAWELAYRKNAVQK